MPLEHRSKRQILAGLSARLGGTSLVERLPRRRCLIVLNYHRIGDPDDDEGDPGVFSATAGGFDEQVAYLKREFHVCSLDEALGYVETRRIPGGAHVLITFDDGYLDNYLHAYPILRSHGVPAAFFLATSLIGSSAQPWWDAIAAMVRRSRRRLLKLGYPGELTIDLKNDGWRRTTRRLLDLYKAPATTEPARFLEELARATGVDRTAAPIRRFLDWHEAKEMLEAGMAIGAHTHHHALLAKQPLSRQREEVAICKRLLETHLKVRVESLAYPVGSPTSFSAETKEALRQTGYRAGLSFYGGVNLVDSLDPFDIKRMSVEADDDQPLFRLRVAGASVAGRAVI